jgi:LacI family transcriptional regulator
LKKVTIEDIAKELNITFSTVARALKNNPAISEATKKAVREAAERLNYRQNRLASSLRSGKTNIVGVIIPSIELSFFSSIVHGIEKVMNENGYTVLLYQSNEQFLNEVSGVETFLMSRVDGIMASIALNTKDIEHFREIKKRNIPLILFDRVNEELEVPAVFIDDFKGGFIATEHLIKEGYRKIVHITSEQNVHLFAERLTGYKEALSFYNIPLRDELIIAGKVSIESGKECVKMLIEKGVDFDTIFAVEDFTALGVLQYLKTVEDKRYKNIGVIGFANEAFGQYITPSLSTIDQQTTLMGEEAAKLFLSLVLDKKLYERKAEQIMLEPKLIIRESSIKRS